MTELEIPFLQEAPFAVTVCDRDGIILAMNDRAKKTFENDGGVELIGTNVLDCHPEPSRSKLAYLLETGESNKYTIEKNGVKKIIIQTPWYESGEFAGLIEISVEIPKEMPHFLRG